MLGILPKQICILITKKYCVDYRILDTLKLKIANLNIFVGFTLGYWSFLQSKTEDCYALLFEKLKEGRRIDVIAIKPIRGLFYLISKGDRKVRKLL